MFTLKTLRSKYLLFCLAVLFSVASYAAPVVDFKIKDNGPPGGCSPFVPSFVNTTTGASASATYKWDFGNGNTPVVKGKDEVVSVSYTTPKKYTVTLTVTDGGQTYSKTMEVTVYQKPTADFTISNPKGCTPLSTTFTSNATPGDGTISKYFWDFGDGTTNNGALATTTHSYTGTQKYDVVLTVTNSYGCGITVTKAAAVEGVGAVTSAFTAAKTTLCDLSETAVFNNTSTGPGTLTYLWDFGDGSSSTDKAASHVYTQKGTYTVKLSTTSSEGCTNVVTQTSYINAQNFTSDFSYPSTVCSGSIATTFTAQSTPAANLYSWSFSDNLIVGNYATIARPFITPGDYVVKLTSTFGNCKDIVEKKITVLKSPILNGFILNNEALCGAPATANVKDTSSSAVKWTWQNGYNGYVFSNTQEASYKFDFDGNYSIYLTITDKAGCTTSTYKQISLQKPTVYTAIKSSNGTKYLNSGCEGLIATFYANKPISVNIVSYSWDFGDGTTSTEAEPKHEYKVAGSYNVALTFTTTDGCTFKAISSQISVYKKPVIDFSASTTNVCGNSVVYFTTTNNNYSYYYQTWSFGDNLPYTYPIGSVQHQYQNEGTYTVTLITRSDDNGACTDTVVKTNYIKVVPPFPKISSQQYTCNGTRGDVIFGNGSRQATGWTWDFRDGSPVETYTTNVPSVKHTFTKTGSYRVLLTTTNGQCSVSDSVMVYVLLKQNPVLSSDQTVICSSGTLSTHIRNLEVNPRVYTNYYYVSNWQKKDLSPLNPSYNYYSFQQNYDGTLSALPKGDLEFRAIIVSTQGADLSYLTCYDTTNFIKVKVKGPTAGIKVITNNVCYQSPIVYGDNSTLGEGVPIKKWEWTFGEYPYTPLVKTTGDQVSYNYTTPGNYYPTLKVTDADGCVSSVTSSVYAQVLGPKADFYWNPASVYPNTTAYFYNSTSGSGSISYLWNFSASKYTTATVTGISRSYAAALVDTVKLVAYNAVTGCKDSITKLVPVKTVSATFTYTTQYVNNNTCPPVAAYFKSTVSNVNSVKWLFGDGSTATNNYSPSHTYNKPGVYKITLIGYGANNITDTTYDYITIKGPYATLSSDVMKGCLPVTVNLTADAKNTTSYMWDYGDGVLEETTGPASSHKYTAPGMYRPTLIMKDDTGCTSSFELTDQVLVDSLSAVIKMNTHTLCSSGKLLLDIDTYSTAAANIADALTQHWDFGTGIAQDTANTVKASFQYSAVGKYIINLDMQSVSGCTFSIKDSLMVNPVAKGVITGPADACEGIPVVYSGKADITNGVAWKWDFANGKSDDHQTPAPQTFTGSATAYQVKLITLYNGCYDTTVKALNVHFKPAVNLLPKAPVICRGKSVQLSAEDGIKYEWTPTDFLDNASVEKPFASPQISTRYFVKVTNTYGCINKDSVDVTVAIPFKINVSKDTFVCAGSSVVLRASGATNYKWISNTADLNDPQVNNPNATPKAEASYTVVGYDAYNCFTDTAVVKVTVKPLPTINVGPDIVTPVGSVVNLGATTSANTSQVIWSPADYLDCTNCLMPVSEPRKPVTYVATAKTQFGCIAKDSLFIDLRCIGNTVTMPTAFTPDKDGKNDVFYPIGKGVRNIKHFVVFNRWGVVIFEKSNVSINDKSAGWNGMYRGDLCAPGSYVYAMEVECDTGENYTVKGTVTLIR